MAGLTPTGLDIKRLPDVLEDIVASEQTNIDPNIVTRDDELLGQLNNIIAVALAEQWELAQAVNDNFNLLKAEGTNLDDLGALTGTSRIGATKSSTASQKYGGTSGSLIPVGLKIESPTTGDRFLTIGSAVLSLADCHSVDLTVTTVSDTTTYDFIVDATAYTYTSDASATESEILLGLKADVDADGTRTWQASIVGSVLTITTDAANINVSGLSNLTEGFTYSLVETEAELAGVVVAPENTVTSFIITVAGISTTTNLVEYSVGSEVETDEIYLERILVSQQQGGGGTLASIEDAVANLAGVTAVSVYDNRTLIVDADGRPGKSFEVIAQGGLDTELAQLIWDKHPAGIETYGLTSLPVMDSNGDPQTVFFTRPGAINFAFRVSYTLYDEEVFPGGGDLAIRNSIVDTTAGLGVGKDVISTRFYGGCYEATTGVSITAVEFQRITNPGDAPGGGSWTTVTDEIDIREFSSTTLVDVTTVVT